MTPPQINTEMLKKMKKTTEDYLDEPMTETMITIPTYFNDNQHQTTKDTDHIADLDVKRIINEPTAATLTYGMNKTKNDHTMIVYDLDNDTFDVSVIEIAEVNNKHQFEVLTTNSDTFLNNENFDIHLIDYLVDEFKKKTNINLKNDPPTKLTIHHIEHHATIQ